MAITTSDDKKIKLMDEDTALKLNEEEDGIKKVNGYSKRRQMDSDKSRNKEGESTYVGGTRLCCSNGSGIDANNIISKTLILPPGDV